MPGWRWDANNLIKLFDDVNGFLLSCYFTLDRLLLWNYLFVMICCCCSLSLSSDVEKFLKICFLFMILSFPEQSIGSWCTAKSFAGIATCEDYWHQFWPGTDAISLLYDAGCCVNFHCTRSWLYRTPGKIWHKPFRSKFMSPGAVVEMCIIEELPVLHDRILTICNSESLNCYSHIIINFILFGKFVAQSRTFGVLM